MFFQIFPQLLLARQCMDPLGIEIRLANHLENEDDLVTHLKMEGKQKQIYIYLMKEYGNKELLSYYNTLSS